MFCRACLIKFLQVLRLAMMLAQACVTAWLSEDLQVAYAHGHNFTQIWSLLLIVLRKG